MWNLGFTMPSAFIFIIFLVYFLLSPMLPVKRNRNFFMLVLFQGLTIATDIWSTYLDNHYDEYPGSLLIVANSAYFLVFTARFFFFVLYVLSVIEQDGLIRRIGFFNKIFFLLSQYLNFVNIYLPIYFYINIQRWM